MVLYDVYFWISSKIFAIDCPIGVEVNRLLGGGFKNMKAAGVGKRVYDGKHLETRERDQVRF